MQLPQLKRIRWAVRAALMLGVAASVAANVLHAQPNPISQAISAWPPLALLLTVELTSRIPMHKRGLAALRVVATMVIAAIAAWVSYWHMQDVAVRYGESEVSAYLLPISVDGLIIVASVSLVELAGRIRALEERRSGAAADPAAATATTAVSAGTAASGTAPLAPAMARAAAPAAPVQFVAPAPDEAIPGNSPLFQRVPARETVAATAAEPYATAPAAAATSTENEKPAASEPVTAAPPPAAPRVPTSPLSGKPLSQSAPVSPAVAATTRPAPAYVNGSTPPARAGVARAAVSAPPRTVVTESTIGKPTTKAAESTTPRQRRPVQETAELAAEIEAMHPEISQTELAKRLGISPTRLRAVRREAREFRRANGAAGR